MEKVYQINENYSDERNELYNKRALGVFTSEHEANSIVAKFEKESTDKLKVLNLKLKEYEEDESKLFMNPNAEYRYLSEEYLQIDDEAQELRNTSYSIEEIILNQLNK